MSAPNDHAASVAVQAIDRRPHLTARQAEVLAFVRTKITENGFPPSLREICAAIKICSTNGASSHLIALERKGYIHRNRMLSRAITLVDPMPATQQTSGDLESLMYLAQTLPRPRVRLLATFLRPQFEAERDLLDRIRALPADQREAMLAALDVLVESA